MKINSSMVLRRKMTGTVLGMGARLVWLLTVVLLAGVVLAVDKGSPIGPDNVWTRTATRFMYAPTIGFDEVPGATREHRYLDAALAIGESFLALQGEDGSWTLKLRCSDGSAVNPNRAFPISQAKLLERLHAVTGRSDYRAAADRAFAYVDRGPLTTWNWEAQFEDAPPEGMYANLDMHSPTDAAIFCLERFPGDARRVALAKDLMKFVEDQFVDWEPPYHGCGDLFVVWGPYGCKVNDQGFQDWITPAVEEQYRTYSPVDASAAKVALGFLACYRATDERTYLEKVRALADTATRVQRDDGSIPTWWNPKTSRDGDWINCMVLQEELKLYPFGEVWAEYCRKFGVPADESWLDDVRKYERNVLAKRG